MLKKSFAVATVLLVIVGLAEMRAHAANSASFPSGNYTCKVSLTPDDPNTAYVEKVEISSAQFGSQLLPVIHYTVGMQNNKSGLYTQLTELTSIGAIYSSIDSTGKSNDTWIDVNASTIGINIEINQDGSLAVAAGLGNDSCVKQ